MKNKKPNRFFKLVGAPFNVEFIRIFISHCGIILSRSPWQVILSLVLIKKQLPLIPFPKILKCLKGGHSCFRRAAVIAMFALILMNMFFVSCLPNKNTILISSKTLSKIAQPVTNKAFLDLLDQRAGSFEINNRPLSMKLLQRGTIDLGALNPTESNTMSIIDLKKSPAFARYMMTKLRLDTTGNNICAVLHTKLTFNRSLSTKKSEALYDYEDRILVHVTSKDDQNLAIYQLDKDGSKVILKIDLKTDSRNQKAPRNDSIQFSDLGFRNGYSRLLVSEGLKNSEWDYRNIRRWGAPSRVPGSSKLVSKAHFDPTELDDQSAPNVISGLNKRGLSISLVDVDGIFLGIAEQLLHSEEHEEEHADIWGPSGAAGLQNFSINAQGVPDFLTVGDPCWEFCSRGACHNCCEREFGEVSWEMADFFASNALTSAQTDIILIGLGIDPGYWGWIVKGVIHLSLQITTGILKNECAKNCDRHIEVSASETNCPTHPSHDTRVALGEVCAGGKPCVGRAVCGNGNGKCVPCGKCGVSGDYCTNNSQCKGRCNVTNNGEGVCIGGDVGDPCTNNTECPGWCDKSTGRCRAPVALGRLCTGGKQCVEGAVCGSGNERCVPDGDGRTGDYCTRNSQCRGFCNASGGNPGTCQD